MENTIQQLAAQGMPVDQLYPNSLKKIPTREELIAQGVPEENINYIITRATLEAQGVGNGLNSKSRKQLLNE